MLMRLGAPFEIIDFLIIDCVTTSHQPPAQGRAVSHCGVLAAVNHRWRWWAQSAFYILTMQILLQSCSLPVLYGLN